jgi:ribonuclease P/MRP protein subunit RPP1
LKLYEDFINSDGEGEREKIKLLNRITIKLIDVKGASIFNTNNYNTYLKHFDLIAVEVTDASLLQTAINNLNIDLVSLNLGEKLNFRLKPKMFTNSFVKGIHFEINYDSLLTSGSNRRNLLSNARELVKCLKAKNLIISSNGDNPLKFRSVNDLCKLGALWGMNEFLTRKCFTEFCRSCCRKGENRKDWVKSGVRVVETAIESDKASSLKRPLETTSPSTNPQKKTK